MAERENVVWLYRRGRVEDAWLAFLGHCEAVDHDMPLEEFRRRMEFALSLLG